MKKILILLTLSTLLISCGDRSGLEFNEKFGLEAEAQGELITFQNLKNRILEPHCMTCHKRSGTEEGIERWVVAGNPESSKLFNVIKNGSMPKKADPLPLSDVEFVRQYILDMAKIRVLETIDFDTLKNEILVPHCLSCHKRMDNEESLMKWINPNDPMKSRLLQAVVEGKMPKKADPLKVSEQNIIIKYLNNFLTKENQ